MKWPVGRLIWESKGYTMKTVAKALKDALPKNAGLSLANIQRKATDLSEDIPDDVAKALVVLPVEKDHYETAHIVLAGLEALGGKGVDLATLATSLRTRTEVDPEVITRALDALASDVRGVHGDLLRHWRENLKDRETLSGLRTLQLRGFVALGAVVVLVNGGILLYVRAEEKAAQALTYAAHAQELLAMRLSRVQEQAEANRPPAWLQLPPPATPTGARARVGRPVPKKPFKGQMLAPCGFFVAISGGCWSKQYDATTDKALRAPCPADMYESGGYCFLPIGERGEPLPSTLDGDE